MRKFIFVMAILTCISLNPVIVKAEELIIQPGPQDGMDTYTVPYNPDSNFGASTMLYARMWAPNAYANSFIRFDIPQALTGAIINNAYLSTYGTGYGDNRFTVDVHGISRQWYANSVTWNNQPEYDPEYAYSFLTPDGSYWGWTDCDITNFVKGWASDPSSNFGVLLSPNPNTPDMRNYTFFSSDFTGVSSWRPKMTINYSAAPEPASMILFGLGGLALGFLRRRKP